MKIIVIIKKKRSQTGKETLVGTHNAPEKDFNHGSIVCPSWLVFFFWGGGFKFFGILCSSGSAFTNVADGRGCIFAHREKN